MNNKIFPLIIAGTIISAQGFSQTVKENIDKAAKDKSTADRAAKADVLVQKKTASIYNADSQSASSVSSNVSASQSHVKVKRKKHHKHWRKKRKSVYK